MACGCESVNNSNNSTSTSNSTPIKKLTQEEMMRRIKAVIGKTK